MPHEMDPEEVIRLPLHPVRAGIKLRSREDIRLLDRGKNLEPKPNIVDQIMKMINNRQFPTLLIRIVDRRQIGEEPELQLRIVVQELHNFQVKLLWRLKGQQAIRLLEMRELVPKLRDQPLFDCLVG